MFGQATQPAKSKLAPVLENQPTRRGELRPSTADQEVQILRGDEALWLLCHERTDLDAFAACPMQSWAWRAACAESFPDGEPIAIVVRRAGGVAGIAALTRARRNHKLLALGHELFEPTAFSYRDAASCAALAAALVRLRRPTFLRDLASDSLFVGRIQDECRRERICIVRPMAAHPWLPLDESWRDPESHLSSKRRSDLRRARRAAETFGSLRLTAHTPDIGSLDALLKRVFEVEATNWKGHQGSAMLRTPAIHEFYRRYARYACRQGILRVLTLTLGDHLAAVQVGVNFNNRFWLLKMGYDEKYARCSPGLLLMVESLRCAAEAGLEAYEMMGEQEPWNIVWTDQVHPSVSVRIYGPGIAGAWHAAREAASAAGRKASAWRNQRKQKP